MSRNPRTRSHAILALMALLAGVGCSNLPTGPSAEATSQTASAGAGREIGSAALLPVPRPNPTITSITSIRRIHGAIGGTVSAGNFTVVIPPMAVSGMATVKVTQLDPAKPYVSLEISPASANKFRVPVTLIANAEPLTSEKLRVAYISWYNPSTHQWERMESSEVSLVNRTVICPLRHFSEYSVQVDSKAGW